MAAEVKVSRKGLERCTQRPIANDGEVALRVPLLHKVHGPQQVLAPFLLDKPTHEENALR